jgi:kynureninase
MNFENSLGFARQLDISDPLKSVRQNFTIPPYGNREAIYFLGNSLGLQPKRCSEYINNVLNQWAELGVDGFFNGSHPWMNYHDALVGPLSKITGALSHELVVMNSLTVNLQLMLSSFYRLSGIRRKIICESKAFPSDQYAVETHLKFRNLDPDDTIIEVKPRPGEEVTREEDILKAIEENKEELALVFLGAVNYYTGQVFDIARITNAAHAVGAIAGFDLAHAAGNIFLDLHNWDVDFACWCSYKYLNSGPGAIGGCFINERYHNDTSIKRLAGWWGHQKESRFKMEPGFIPIESAEGWQLSTPSALLYAAHLASLDIFRLVEFKELVQKSEKLTGYLFYLITELNNRMPAKAITILTPLNQKGCQLSLLMSGDGKSIFEQLTSKGFFADWREPNVIRVAPVPLYNTFEEVWSFVDVLKDIINGH